MTTILRLATFFAFLFIGTSTFSQTRIYVDQDAPGPTIDGSSWTYAYTSLAEALYQAAEGDTVWVAGGIYKPDRLRDGTYSPTDFLSTFALPDHIVMLGGFSGTETADSQRDWRANPVILSGDIGSIGQRGDNACHVIFNPDTAEVDGFIIEDGNGEVHTSDLDQGAGIYNDGKLIINNSIIRNNRCRYGGGLFSNDDSYLEMHRCLVYDNEAFYDGWSGSGEAGGLELQNIGYALIEQSTIWGNQAVWGDYGISTFGSTPSIVNSSIIWENNVTNSTLTYTCAPGATGPTNLDTVPLLTEPDSGDFTLMRGSPCINTGDPGNPLDPDGTTADMGFEVYEHDTIDLGIMAFNHWDGGFMTGSQDVTVTLKSFGTETITSADIGWKVDGAAQTPFSWSGSLSLYEDKDSIVIGTYDFTHNYHTLEAWIMDPNGKTDEYTSNDTLIATEFACDSVLNGTYHVGAGKTYNSFQHAADALCNCGISDSTIFLVDPGTYNEQVLLKDIPGTGPENRVIFSSLNEDNTSVILTYTPVDQSKPYTLKLDSTDYTTFQWMTIASRDSLWGHTIELNNGADRNEFIKNVITGDSLTSHLVYIVPESGTDSCANYLLIRHSLFRLGKWSVYIEGQPGLYLKGLELRSNEIEDFYNGAVHLKYMTAPQILANRIECTLESSEMNDMIHLYYVNDITRIKGNKLYKHHRGNYTTNGIRFNSSSGGSINNEIQVINNFISINSGNTCFYSSSSGKMKIFNNTFLSYGTSGSPFSVDQNTFQVYNNSFVNLAGGIAANYAYTPVPDCDYNNYYGTGDYLIQNGANKPTTIQEWIDSVGVDQHSISSISGFFGMTDLHTLSADLDSAGTPLTDVNGDIDGQSRNATHPDIGADEFDYPGAMRGDYIIGSSGTADFESVSDALNHVYMLHIDSITNLLLEPEEHEEQLVIFPVPGATSAHPLTLTSSSGDSSDTWISYHNQTLQKDYVYHLSGAKHLHFKNLGFSSERTEKYQGIILLTDSCVDIAFTGNYFLTAKSSFSLYGDLISSEDYRNTELAIEGNYFHNGWNGINIISETYLKYHNKVNISRNEFRNQSNAGIYVDLAKEISINSNRFYSTPEFAGSGGINQGIHIQNTGKGEVYEPTVMNNIFDMHAQTASFPIQLLSSDSLLVLHNTVYSDVTPIHILSCNGTIANNIFHATTGNTGFDVGDTAGLALMHNVYYIDDLYDWEVAFDKMDPTSFEADPVYEDLQSFIPTSPFLKNTGKYFSEAPYDINGVNRFPDPDIGAIEFENALYQVPFADTSVCYGESMIVDAGEGFDSYSWSNDSTGQTFNLVSTNYGGGEREFRVTVDIQGNQYKDTVNVMIAVPEVDLGPDISNCANDTAILDGGPGYAWYDWNDSRYDGLQYCPAPMSANTNYDYILEITDQYGCKARDTVNVSGKAIPGGVNIIPENDTTLRASITGDVFELQWYMNGEPIAGATADVYYMQGGGIYMLEGITQEGCSGFSEEYVNTTSIQPMFSNQRDNAFNIYPNPAYDKFYLSINQIIKNPIISLTDIQGRWILILRKGDLQPGEVHEMDISGLPAGIYNLRIQSDDNCYYQRLIIQ